jgi:hypothetical protein
MHPFSTAALVVFFLYKITIRFHEFVLGSIHTQTDVEHNVISRFKEHVWCVRGSKIMEWQSAEWIMLEWLRCISFDCAPTSARLPATISLTKSNLPKESRFCISFHSHEARRRASRERVKPGCPQSGHYFDKLIKAMRAKRMASNRLLVFPLQTAAALPWFIITSRGNNKYHCNDACGCFVILTKSEDGRRGNLSNNTQQRNSCGSPIISDKKLHHDAGCVFTLSFWWYYTRLLFSSPIKKRSPEQTHAVCVSAYWRRCSLMHSRKK